MSATCWVCGGTAEPDPQYSSAQLYRCAQCAFLFAPRRAREELEQLYGSAYFETYAAGKTYDQDEAQRRYEARLRIRWLQSRVQSGRVLEVGSAGGYFLDEARRAGYDVLGVEPGEEEAQRSRERLDVDVRTGFLDDVDLPDGHFDAACAFHVLEHINNPATALGRLRKALRPGGLLLLEVPNVESVRSRRYRDRWLYLDPEHHVGQYGPGTLRLLLERNEFEPVTVDTFPMLGYVRPQRALLPGNVAVQARELIQLRTAPRRPHPFKHEVLRALAVSPVKAPSSGAAPPAARPAAP